MRKINGWHFDGLGFARGRFLMTLGTIAGS
jgi:hypothetical protein